jgi:acetyl-CoA acetyltransferase
VSARTSGAYAIAGIGETAVGKLPEQTTTGLALAAARAAILDAGLTVGEIDGIVCDQPNNLPYRSYALALARNLGIAPSYATDIALGGASTAGCVIHAIMAIAAGLCTTVVGIHTQKQATGRSEARHGQLSDGLEDYEEPFGLTSAVSQHATVAARHMHEFGTTSEQLAAVAVAFRKHAALNPAAMMRAPDHEAAPLARLLPRLGWSRRRRAHDERTGTLAAQTAGVRRRIRPGVHGRAARDADAHHARRREVVGDGVRDERPRSR